MKASIKNLISVSLSVLLGLTAVSGCGTKNKQPSPTAAPAAYTSDTYVFVAKDIQNTYMQKVYEGFKDSCSEIGINTAYEAPESPTAEKQIEIIKRLIDQKVKGIAIAANDENALEPALKEAMDAGIKVISLDSAVNKDSRQIHIQQADPEEIGSKLIRTAYNITNGEGGIAILTTTEQATNQNLWISYMKKELEAYPDKYASTPLITTVYGDDDYAKSKTETLSLIENPNIRVIICPTAVGLNAAGEVLQNTSMNIRLTGLGMPSQIAPFIESGICPHAYLWNTSDIGYLAGYALNALDNGQITGAKGDIFSAGHLGEKTVSTDSEGGTEVILGDLLEFNSYNISESKDMY